jgi:hypothetical protein
MWIALGIGAAVVVALVIAGIALIRKNAATGVMVQQQNETIKEQERRRVEQEKRDADASKKRTDEFNAKADAATTPAAANDLLRDAIRGVGPGKPL